MKTKVERLEEALQIAQHSLGNMTAYSGTFASQAKNTLALMDKALSPPIEYETVEVVRYTVITPNGGCLGTYPTPEAAEGVMHETYQLVPLTGTYQRPKAQPVERSVSVEADIKGNGGLYAKIPLGHATFGRYPECHGKTGTLTFTWTER